MSLDDVAHLQGTLIGGGIAVAVLAWIAWNARKNPPPWIGSPEADEAEDWDEEE